MAESRGNQRQNRESTYTHVTTLIENCVDLGFSADHADTVFVVSSRVHLDELVRVRLVESVVYQGADLLLKRALHVKLQLKRQLEQTFELADLGLEFADFS